MILIDKKTHNRFVRTPEYNYNFRYSDGYFERWGRTKAPTDDSEFSPIGPEILDLELTVNGCPNNCAFCYKGNTKAPPTNMSFDTFKIILDKMPSVMQVAFGITGVQANPDFIRIMEYCRSKNVAPNFTLSGIDLTEEIAEKCAKLVGAVAVSIYKPDKNIGYNAVKKFTDLGVKQVNCHLMTSEQTLPFIYEIFNDYKTDERLRKVGAFVLLGLKPKGRAKDHFDVLSYSKFKELVEHCLDSKIPLGFDSCQAPRFERVIRENSLPEEMKSRYLSMSESCESFGIFSSYINVHGDYFPCSFCEGEGEWKEGISVLNCSNFLKDVWYSEKLNKYRKMSVGHSRRFGCRKCLIFNLE